MGLGLEPPRIRRCANRCDFCFVDGLPDRTPGHALHPRRRLPALVPVRQLRHAHQSQAAGRATGSSSTGCRRCTSRCTPLTRRCAAGCSAIRRAPDILEQLRRFAAHGIAVPYADGVVARGQRRCGAGTVADRPLRLRRAVLTVSVVPVGLTEFSKHHLVREPTEAECAAAVRLVERHAAAARAERGIAWCLGADELYLRAGLDCRARGLRRLRPGGERRRVGALPAGAYPGGGRGARPARRNADRCPHRDLDGRVDAAGARPACGGDGRHLRADRASRTPCSAPPSRPPGCCRAPRSSRPCATAATSTLRCCRPSPSTTTLLFMDDVEAHALQAQLPVKIRFSHHFTDALAAPVPA